MHYPEFFDAVETITFKDELSGLLGSFEDERIEFSYLDVVKAAGHSCPTTAGAYLLVQRAVEELYIGDRLPVRGEITVELANRADEGVTGVMANVFTQLTGAAGDVGFPGLTKRFKRTGLLEFDKKIKGEVKFTRTDSNRSVELKYDPYVLPSNPKVIELMIEVESNRASKEEKKEFQKLWQQRVKTIFDNADKVISLVS
ncbi:MAG: FmdE family protein [Campylobacterota bacterium]